MLNNDRTVRVGILTVVIASPAVHLNETEESLVCSRNATACKNLCNIEHCYLRRLSLKTCYALAVQPALTANCGVRKIVSTVGCLELELVACLSVVLAYELGRLGKFLLATCSNSKCSFVVVDIILIVAPNSSEGISLASLGKNNICNSIVCVESILDSLTCSSIGVSLGSIDCSLKSLTGSSNGITDTLNCYNFLSRSDKSQCSLAGTNLGLGVWFGLNCSNLNERPFCSSSKTCIAERIVNATYKLYLEVFSALHNVEQTFAGIGKCQLCLSLCKTVNIPVPALNVVTRSRLQIVLAICGSFKSKNLIVVIGISNDIDTAIRSALVFIGIANIKINSTVCTCLGHQSVLLTFNNLCSRSTQSKEQRHQEKCKFSHK